MKNTVLENFTDRKIEKKINELNRISDFIDEYDKIIQSTSNIHLREECKSYLVKYCNYNKDTFRSLYENTKFIELGASSIFKLMMFKRKVSKAEVFDI